MPTYEYKCDACGFKFEKFQSIVAAPIRKCPHCGKTRVKRLIGTGAGLIFKGGGFYITDYRSESYKNAAKSDVPPPAPAADTKAASDTAAKPPVDAKPTAESKPTVAAEPKIAKSSSARPAKRGKFAK